MSNKRHKIYVKVGEAFYEAYTASQIAKSMNIQPRTFSANKARRGLPEGLKTVKLSKQIVLYYKEE